MIDYNCNILHNVCCFLYKPFISSDLFVACHFYTLLCLQCHQSNRISTGYQKRISYFTAYMFVELYSKLGSKIVLFKNRVLMIFAWADYFSNILFFLSLSLFIYLFLSFSLSLSFAFSIPVSFFLPRTCFYWRHLLTVH